MTTTSDFLKKFDQLQPLAEGSEVLDDTTVKPPKSTIGGIQITQPAAGEVIDRPRGLDILMIWAPERSDRKDGVPGSIFLRLVFSEC